MKGRVFPKKKKKCQDLPGFISDRKNRAELSGKNWIIPITRITQTRARGDHQLRRLTIPTCHVPRQEFTDFQLNMYKRRGC